jgi:hypothetical protein
VLQPGHPSQGLEILLGITIRFFSECERREKSGLVLIFPTVSSIQHYEQSGKLAMAPYVRRLQAGGFRYLDLTTGIAEWLAGRSGCGLLARADACEGHYSPKGNRLVAELVYEYLAQSGLAASAKAAVDARATRTHPCGSASPAVRASVQS